MTPEEQPILLDVDKAYEYWLDCREEPHGETFRGSCDESHKRAFIAGWRAGCKFSWELAQKRGPHKGRKVSPQPTCVHLTPVFKTSSVPQSPSSRIPSKTSENVTQACAASERVAILITTGCRRHR